MIAPYANSKCKASINITVNYTFKYVFHIKIVSTFAVDMMKYIVCILLGIFLMLGCVLIPNKEWQEFRSETGTTNIQSRIQSSNLSEKTVIQQSGKERCFVEAGNYSRKYDHELNDGILGHSLSPRPASPSKIIRFNLPSVTIQLLSSIKIQLTKNQSAGLSYYTNLTKYSYRYYVYTLKRILI